MCYKFQLSITLGRISINSTQVTWVQDLTLWMILIQKKLSISPNCFIALKFISQGSFEKLFNKNRGIGEMSIHWQFKAWNYEVVVIIYVTVLLNIFSSLGLMVRLHRRETEKFRNTMQKIPPNSSSCLAPGNEDHWRFWRRTL